MRSGTHGRKLHFARRALTGPALAATLLAVQADAQDWTYDTGLSGALPEQLTFAANDSTVLSAYRGNESRTVQLPAENSNPANPDWLEVRDELPQYQSLAAAARADVAATLTVESDWSSSTGVRATVRKYSDGSQGQADWERELPIDIFFGNSTGIAVSEDGQRIVAVGCTIDGNLHAYVFQPGSQSWIQHRTFSVSPFRALRASADAKRLYVQDASRVRVLDLDTGSVSMTQSETGEIFTGGHAISGDGKTVAYALADRIVIVRQSLSGGWYELPPLQIDPLAEFCSEVELSRDGSVLAVGIERFDNLTSGVVVVETTSGAQRLEDFHAGSGTYTNAIGDLDLSEDGSTVALALWGDSSQSVPEVSVYATEGTTPSVPSQTFDLPGSALSLDLSTQGQQLVVASKTTHMDYPGFVYSRIDRFTLDDNGGSNGGNNGGNDEDDFWMEGAGQVGEIVTFHFRPQGAGQAFLLVSDGRAPNPFQIGQVGTLYLKRTGLTVYPYSNFQAGSEVEMQYAMPFDPDAAGTDLYFQGFSHTPRRLSADWVHVTVAP